MNVLLRLQLWAELAETMNQIRRGRIDQAITNLKELLHELEQIQLEEEANGNA